MRVPYRDPRRDRKAIDRATGSRELTPEEQILALHSVIGNAAVADLLGHGAATGAADAKSAQYTDGKGAAETAGAKGNAYADSKSAAAAADGKGAAETAGAKGNAYADSKSAAAAADGKGGAETAGAKGDAYADGKSAADSQDSKQQDAASTYEIDWLYELRTRKPRS